MIARAVPAPARRSGPPTAWLPPWNPTSGATSQLSPIAIVAPGAVWKAVPIPIQHPRPMATRPAP